MAHHLATAALVLVIKTKNYRNAKLLAAVRSLPCVNCGMVGTQAAHSNQLEHGKGQSLKASDAAIMALCVQNSCHFNLDNGNKMSKLERRDFTYEMIAKTLMNLLRNGKLIIEGAQRKATDSEIALLLMDNGCSFSDGQLSYDMFSRALITMVEQGILVVSREH